MSDSRDKSSIYQTICDFIESEIEKNPKRVFYLDEKFIENRIMNDYYEYIQDILRVGRFECEIENQGVMSPIYPEIPKMGYIFKNPENPREKLATLLRQKSE